MELSLPDYDKLTRDRGTLDPLSKKWLAMDEQRHRERAANFDDERRQKNLERLLEVHIAKGESSDGKGGFVCGHNCKLCRKIEGIREYLQGMKYRGILMEGSIEGVTEEDLVEMLKENVGRGDEGFKWWLKNTCRKGRNGGAYQPPRVEEEVVVVGGSQEHEEDWIERYAYVEGDVEDDRSEEEHEMDEAEDDELVEGEGLEEKGAGGARKQSDRKTDSWIKRNALMIDDGRLGD